MIFRRASVSGQAVALCRPSWRLIGFPIISPPGGGGGRESAGRDPGQLLAAWLKRLIFWREMSVSWISRSTPLTIASPRVVSDGEEEKSPRNWGGQSRRRGFKARSAFVVSKGSIALATRGNGIRRRGAEWGQRFANDDNGVEVSFAKPLLRHSRAVTPLYAFRLAKPLRTLATYHFFGRARASFGARSCEIFPWTEVSSLDDLGSARSNPDAGGDGNDCLGPATFAFSLLKRADVLVTIEARSDMLIRF